MNCYSPLYLILIVLLFACQENKKQNEIFLRPVKTVKAKTLETITKTYTGFVQAKEFSVLAFKVSGPLITFNVSEGQKVKKGTLIAQIDPQDYQLQYEAKQAAYQTTTAIYNRNRRLFAENAIAVQSMEMAEADYIQAKSAVNIASRTLDYTRLTAPFDGIIEKQYVENFQEILVGNPIVKLVNPEEIEVYFMLPETNIQLIEVPKTIYVEFDTHKGKLFTSEIKEYIYSSQGSGIPVTLKITDQEFAPYRKDVFPGFSCKVIFDIENTILDNFIIPSSALFTEQEKQYVYIVTPQTHTIQRRLVTAISFDDKALVKKGLNSDDRIVIAGIKALTEGQKVQFIE